MYNYKIPKTIPTGMSTFVKTPNKNEIYLYGNGNNLFQHSEFAIRECTRMLVKSMPPDLPPLLTNLMYPLPVPDLGIDRADGLDSKNLLIIRIIYLNQIKP